MSVNMLALFDVVREIGVDMVEFDVCGWDGELVFAYIVLYVCCGGNVRFVDVLFYLIGCCFCDVELNVDVKYVGCEVVLFEWLWHVGLFEWMLIFL